MIKLNSGIRTEVPHQADAGIGVKVSKENNNALTINIPRKAPNISPSARSVPVSPVKFTNWEIK